jgi:hypothetical protein
MIKKLAAALLLLTSGIAAAAPSAHEPRASLQFNCEALNITGQLDEATRRDLEPAHTLDAAAAVLAKHNVKFERSRGLMTMSDAPLAVVRQINTLPQGEPIVLPNGQNSTICVIQPSGDSI